jgi:hypothetical protein
MVGDLVAAVAKGLVGAQAAGTPEVALAGLQFHGIRASLSNFRFRHGEISSMVDIGIIAEPNRPSRKQERATAAEVRRCREKLERKKQQPASPSRSGRMAQKWYSILPGYRLGQQELW